MVRKSFHQTGHQVIIIYHAFGLHRGIPKDKSYGITAKGSVRISHFTCQFRFQRNCKRKTTNRHWSWGLNYQLKLVQVRANLGLNRFQIWTSNSCCPPNSSQPESRTLFPYLALDYIFWFKSTNTYVYQMGVKCPGMYLEYEHSLQCSELPWLFIKVGGAKWD